MARLTRVRSFMPDGTVMLEDGREMQAMVSESGALGVRIKSPEDHVSHLDQHEALDQHGPVATGPPSIASLGLDQT